MTCAHDKDKIEPRGPICAALSKRFSDKAFPAVTQNRLPHFTADGDPQASAAALVRAAIDDEMMGVHSRASSLNSEILSPLPQADTFREALPDLHLW